MKFLSRYFISLFVFWFFVFTINRITFLISLSGILKNASIPDILQTLFSGWRLDLSTIGYIIAFPVLVAIVYSIIRAKWIAVIHDVVMMTFIVVYCLVTFGELCLYQEWAAKLNMQALLHFANPAEVFQSATLKLTLLFFTLVIAFAIFFSIVYRRYFSLLKIANVKQKGKNSISYSLLFLILFFAS